MLSSELGEAGGGILAGEILGGDLLDAGGGKEGDGDGGEQRGDEEDEDEGAAGIGGWDRGFNHNRAPGQAGERATEGWPEGRGSGRDRVKGHGAHGVGCKETCAAMF